LHPLVGAWGDLRRRERVGKLDGVDLLVEKSYAEVYGGDFRDVVAPPAVEEELDAVRGRSRPKQQHLPCSTFSVRAP